MLKLGWDKGDICSSRHPLQYHQRSRNLRNLHKALLDDGESKGVGAEICCLHSVMPRRGPLFLCAFDV